MICTVALISYSLRLYWPFICVCNMSCCYCCCCYTYVCVFATNNGNSKNIQQQCSRWTERTSLGLQIKIRSIGKKWKWKRKTAIKWTLLTPLQAKVIEHTHHALSKSSCEADDQSTLDILRFRFVLRTQPRVLFLFLFHFKLGHMKYNNSTCMFAIDQHI